MGSSTMKIHVIGVFILLDYVTTKVKFFRSNHDLSKVGSHESKFHQAVAAKTELESSLSQLDHDLGRNSDIGSVQVDSEESAEVFQIRNQVRYRRSPSPKKH